MSLMVDNTPPTPEASEPFTPRAEYPRPILVRDQWQSLNGSWLFRVDPGNRGLTDAWFDGPWTDAQTITVPFSMESAASGIAEAEGAAVVWYQREVIKPEAWDRRRHKPGSPRRGTRRINNYHRPPHLRVICFFGRCALERV